MIRNDSLSQTVDAVCEAEFERRQVPALTRRRVARWIVAQQDKRGAYADTFAGSAEEREAGIHVFTGERMTSASARHILGEEACRALRWLDVDTQAVRNALQRANDGLLDALAREERRAPDRGPGIFCCGKCSVAMWRNVLSGGLDRREERLQAGVAALRNHRVGAGRWSVFPFWYTVLALAEMDTRSARDELAYAEAPLRRALQRRASTLYGQRRRSVAERALDRLS